MLYFSRWDSPQAARDFAKLYADYLPKRYHQVVLQQPATASAMNATDDQPPFAFERTRAK